MKDSLGGEGYALSELAVHMLLFGDIALEDIALSELAVHCFGPCGGMTPGAAGLEDCETSPRRTAKVRRVKTRIMVAEKTLYVII